MNWTNIFIDVLLIMIYGVSIRVIYMKVKNDRTLDIRAFNIKTQKKDVILLSVCIVL